MSRPQIIVENGIITLKMYAETTAQVAKLLEQAIFYLNFKSDTESAQCQMLAALFRAATIAGVSQWNMDPGEMETLNHSLERLGLPQTVQETSE